MRRSNRFHTSVIAVLGASICIFWVLGWKIHEAARAQLNDVKASPAGTQNPGPDESPGDTAVTYVDLTDGRTAKVVKSVKDPRHYFVAPVFALVLPDKGLSDLPGIVHRKDPPAEADGAVTLRFEVLNSSDAIRNHAKHRVMESLGPQEGVPNTDRIEVRRWPIESVTVEVFDDRGLLATTKAGDLSAQGDTFPVSIPFRADALARFVEASNADRVHFSFAAAYVGYAAAGGMLKLDAFSLASQQLELALAARSTFSGEAIGHRDVNELKELMTRTVRAIIYADDSATADRLLGLVQKTVEQALSTAFVKEAPFSLSVDSIKNASETDRAALRKYFEPVLQDRSEEVFTFSSEEELRRHFKHSDNEAKLTKINLAIPIGETATGAVRTLGIDLEGGLGGKTVEEVFNEFVRKHGLTTKVVGNSRWLQLATNVDLYRLNRTNWRSTASVLVDLRIGRSVGRKSLNSSQVKTSFTVDLKSRDPQPSPLVKLVKAPSEVPMPPFGAVRLGMCLPYFGKNLPEGYVWADGRSNWPNGEWVPDYLRGTPVPNLSGRVLRGCRDGNQFLAAKGGHDTHAHRIPDHTHGLPAMTSGIADKLPSSLGHYSVARAGGDTTETEFLLTIDQHVGIVDGKVKGSQPQGNHAHKIGGETQGLLKAMYVAGDDRNGADPSEQFVPSYVAVQYIIRVR